MTRKTILDMVKRHLIMENKASLASVMKLMDGPRNANCLMFRPIRTRCVDCKDVTPPTKKAKMSKNLNLSDDSEYADSSDEEVEGPMSSKDCVFDSKK